MNILEAEDLIKGLPDQALMQEAQGPSGQVPQYLVVSEIQRRSDMRKRLKEETPQGTVKDQIMQGGIGGINTPMPQQGMPPQGGMPVAPSATGMPPQGMPPQMPPQGMPPQGMPPQGMPPQMPPQGIGAMPPPQQMFSGGIIKLAPGGFTGMPGEGALVGASEAIKAKAQAISAATGRTFDEVYARLVSMSSMPDAPDFSGRMPDIPTLNPASQISAGLPSMPDMGGIGSSIKQGISETPFGQVSAAAEQSIKDVYNKDGFGAAVGEAGRGLLGTAASVFPTIAQGYAPAIEGLKAVTQGPANALDQFFTGDTSDPLTLNDIFGYSSNEDQLQEVTVDAQRREGLPRGESDAPAITNAIQDSTPNDASAKSLKEMIGDLGVQSQGVQRQGLTDQTRQGATSGAKDFDLSDLIAESKKDTMNNALMQLGAGIAGGDLSKGISAAGMAASKGQQRSKDMAIQERLMSYRAGREDLAREAEESQFSRKLASQNAQFASRLGMMERQLDAQIEKGQRVSKGQLVEMATKLALDAVPDSQFGDVEGARAAAVQNIFRDLVTQYAGFMDVDTADLPAPLATATSQSGRSEAEIAAMYGL